MNAQMNMAGETHDSIFPLSTDNARWDEPESVLSTEVKVQSVTDGARFRLRPTRKAVRQLVPGVLSPSHTLKKKTETTTTTTREAVKKKKEST